VTLWGAGTVVARRVGAVIALAGAALVPWLVVLATTLPAVATARNWPEAWVGLDAMEAAGLLATGLLLRAGSPLVSPAAGATAALLLADAWFDVVTAAPGGDEATSVAMALGAELPLAAVCAVVAVRAVTAKR
jgi:hypothetical protein